MSARAAMRRTGLAAAALLALAVSFVRVNLTPSLPRGLYCRLPVRHVTEGLLVVLCLPPEISALYRVHARSVTGSCPDRLPPFFKVVAATGGDIVTFGPEGLTSGGALLPSSAPRLRDSAGLPLPHAAFGTYRLRPGSVWLYAPEPRSFDSRYFGPLPAKDLLYRLTPLWLLAPSPPFCRLAPFCDRLVWRNSRA
jgi:conjugative transfer signal peptidase TraF